MDNHNRLSSAKHWLKQYKDRNDPSGPKLLVAGTQELLPHPFRWDGERLR